MRKMTKTEAGRKGGLKTTWAKVIANRAKARAAAMARWHPVKKESK